MRLLTAVCLALFAVGCGVEPPTAPASVLPKAGEPATIELSATPGIGEKGGTATITARVLDGLFSVLPNTTVTFAADAGSLASQAVQTDDNGIATTTLTASPGAVKVTASAGSIHAPATTVAIQPVSTTTTPPPPSTPPPPVPTPPDIPLTVTLIVTPAAAGDFTSLSLVSGPIASAVWTFGDGSLPLTTIAIPGVPPTASHRYAVGPYTASVTVTDARGRTASNAQSFTITVAPPPPPASFTVTLTPDQPSVEVGAAVKLTAAATPKNTTAVPTTFQWDCGDSSPMASDALATHTCTYATIGTKAPRVIASNGAVTGTASTSVTVTPQPAPEITVSCGPVTVSTGPTTCSVSAKVNGAAVGASVITSVTWDFGDASQPPTTTTTSNTTTHAYTGAATYQVVVSDVIVVGTTTKGSGSGLATVNP